MKTTSTLLITVLLIITTSAFSMTNQEREIKVAKKNTTAFIKAASLTKDEQSQVYKILLDKEQQNTMIKNKYKGDKVAYRSAIKPLNRTFNRQIKDIIGAERMNQVNDYKKAKREALTKSLN